MPLTSTTLRIIDARHPSAPHLPMSASRRFIRLYTRTLDVSFADVESRGACGLPTEIETRSAEAIVGAVRGRGPVLPAASNGIPHSTELALDCTYSRLVNAIRRLNDCHTQLSTETQGQC